MDDREFIIVIRHSPTSFRYTVLLVPTGGDHRDRDRDYITGRDTLWGAMRAIRKERRRLKLGGAHIIHREPA